MTRNDSIPDGDAIAAAARRALQRLAGGSAADSRSWEDVGTRARGIRRRRIAVVGVACAFLLVGGGVSAATVVANANEHSSQHASGATRAPSTSSSVPLAPTTSNTANTTATAAAIPAPIATNADAGISTTGPSVAPPDLSKLYPSDAPGVDDFEGAITITNVNANVQTINAFDEVEVSTNIRNITDRTVSATSALGSLATVCTSAATGHQSLWIMTSLRLSPGDHDGRSGKFWLTHDYVGTVSCELDIVAFAASGTGGTEFDTSTHADGARGTIIGRVARVALVTLQIQPVDFTLTTSGRLGPLQLGGSNEGDVRVAIGTPEATAISAFAAGRPNYEALGYECSDEASAERIPLHAPPSTVGPFCRTVFYVNLETKRLAGFSTSSAMFRTEQGTTVGMPEAETRQREGRAPQTGCVAGIALGDLAQGGVEIHIAVGAEPTDTVSRISAEEGVNQVGIVFC